MTNNRRDYEMSEDDLLELLEAMKPIPYMIIGGQPPPNRQENANAAWARLGKKLGFEPMSVCPNGRGDRFFSAAPQGDKP